MVRHGNTGEQKTPEPGDASDSEQFVLVGKITKAHGIKGELKVFAFSGDPADFGSLKNVLLRPSGRNTPGQAVHYLPATATELPITSFREQGKMALLVLKGITDRTQAETLAGLEVWTREEYLPELADDEFYWHEMVGLKVLLERGQEIGTVKGLLATGGHDILVIVNKYGREYLIPAQNEFIVEVDYQAGTLTIAPPPGLLEMNG